MTRSYTSMVYLSLITALFVGEKLEELDVLKDIESLTKNMLEEMDALSKKKIATTPKSIYLSR